MQYLTIVNKNKPLPDEILNDYAHTNWEIVFFGIDRVDPEYVEYVYILHKNDVLIESNKGS